MQKSKKGLVENIQGEAPQPHEKPAPRQYKKPGPHKELKLTIELIPKTAWFKNLRSALKNSEWDEVRKKCYARANYKCEICGEQGKRHPVECHEKWSFAENTITLTRLIALCPSCHEVKHMGLAHIRGRSVTATRHFMKVNNISRKEADCHIQQAFRLFEERSRIPYWKLDFTYLEDYATP